MKRIKHFSKALTFSILLLFIVLLSTSFILKKSSTAKSNNLGTVAILPVHISYHQNVINKISTEEEIMTMEIRDSKIYQREFQSYFQYLNEKKKLPITFQPSYITDSLLRKTEINIREENNYQDIIRSLNANYLVDITLKPNFIISDLTNKVAYIFTGSQSPVKGQIYFSSKVVNNNSEVI